MSDLYQYGETVDILVQGAQVFSADERGLFITIPGSSASVALPMRTDGRPLPAISINRVSPAGGPVEPGDLWRDAEGGVWLACTKKLRHGGSEIWLTRGADEDDAGSVRAVSGDFGPLTLMFREALVSQPGADGPGAEYTDESGSTWLSRPDDMFALAGVPDVLGSGAWRTRAEVEADFGPLTAKGDVSDPLAVASQQLRESTDGDSFASAFGGFMTELGKAAEHEQGFHDDCDPARCADAEARVAELHGETPAVKA